MTPAHIEVNQVITRINFAWLHERGDALTTALEGCFAEDVVMRGPGFVLLGTGREFAVQSYHQFVAKATVTLFSLGKPEIDVSGETATAQYKWKMTYSINGQESVEEGYDLYVLSLRNGRWMVVWRAMLPQPN